MNASVLCRIVMVGPHGERDYVEKLLEGGCPCICGQFVEYAMLVPYPCAENLALRLRESWLNPHVAVELEAAFPALDASKVIDI